MEVVTDTTTTRAMATDTIPIHKVLATITGTTGEMALEGTNTQEASNTQAPAITVNALALVGDCFVLVGLSGSLMPPTRG